MVTALLFVAIASLITAAFFWTRSGTASAELAQVRHELDKLAGSHAELKETVSNKAQKDKNRGSEVEDLREKQKDLRRRLTEATEQAKKLKDTDEARRQGEHEARAQADAARAEAAELSKQLKALKLELDQTRGRRPAPRPEPVAAPVVAPVVAAPAPVAPSAEVSDLEAKLKERDGRLAELDGRVKTEQRKAVDLSREVEQLKAKGSTSEKLYVVQKGELELWKDCYRTLEQRLNKTLREVDALHRGVLALEKRLPQATVAEARAEVERGTAEAEAKAEKAAEAAKAAEEAETKARQEARAAEAAALAAKAEPEKPAATPEA